VKRHLISAADLTRDDALLILDTARFDDLAYRIGHNAVRTVMLDGALVS